MSALPEPTDSNFGRKEYWNDFYKNTDSFSWYSGWEDLAPFVEELLLVAMSTDHAKESASILVPGVGNDPLLVDMYDAGYENLVAFDYAPEGVECAKQLLGENRKVEVMVADARDLPLDSDSFDAILEKGTLDSIYLSGGFDKDKAKEYLEMAVDELARVTRPGGIFISITAACVDAVQAAMTTKLSASGWTEIRDGDFYMTEEGYATNNIDGTLLAWRRND
jgi:SAM-dependent methyltransferase